MSKARKKRENQVYIKDIAEWKAAVAKPILLVAEIFAPHFGPCEIMFPFIDELMTNLDNQGQADKVHWAIVNVAKLEDEKAASNAEDALKKQETKVAEKPKEESEGAASEDIPPAGTAPEQQFDEPESAVDGSEQLDTTIPYLEKYSGFNHPTPHYVFFRNGAIIEELRGANPPRLEQLVRKWVAESAGESMGIVAAAATADTPLKAAEVPPIQDPDLQAIPPGERPRRGSMSLYAPDDDDSREPSPERSPADVAAPTQTPPASAPTEAETLPSSASLLNGNPANEATNSAPSAAESVGQAAQTDEPGNAALASKDLAGSPVDHSEPGAAVPLSTSQVATSALTSEVKQADASAMESTPGASPSTQTSELLKDEPPTIPT